MLACYGMKNRISLQQFNGTICEGVIAPFHLEYSKSLYAQLQHFKWQFLKTLYACYRSILRQSNQTIFEGVIPFLTISKGEKMFGGILSGINFVPYLINQSLKLC